MKEFYQKLSTTMRVSVVVLVSMDYEKDFFFWGKPSSKPHNSRKNHHGIKKLWNPHKFVFEGGSFRTPWNDNWVIRQIGKDSRMVPRVSDTGVLTRRQDIYIREDVPSGQVAKRINHKPAAAMTKPRGSNQRNPNLSYFLLASANLEDEISFKGGSL